MTTKMATASMCSPHDKCNRGGCDQQDNDQAAELGQKNRCGRALLSLRQLIRPILREPPGSLGSSQSPHNIRTAAGGQHRPAT